MPIRRRIELTVSEARLRFQQLVRVTGLTGQVTVIVDGGRPIAAIVPAAAVLGDAPATSPSVPAPRSGFPPGPRTSTSAGPSSTASAEGWMRRIEKVREDVRKQHAGRIGELSQALDEAWRLLDSLRPPGSDRAADTLRATHADLRKPPGSITT
ncbi:hypothetical protein SAMN04489716_0048 [Actinoplanes derwentensis]|uniref:Prevent-host-death family protein n=2 Tax=Actinoplanes derwentensis TaxID=113562 RepID=A0A1H1PKL1_9ACTN|nr:hypothetical protein Ade03nite_38220 [Actinoplanes derwentensis]SDS11684.1 hypothetical protein SAMN04489716_0048 [Actinoplanes derwentensis]